MAWCKNQMNGRPEPAYFMHHPAITNADGMKYSVAGYSESLRSERYEAKTEQSFQLRGPHDMTDYEHSPPRKDMYKDHSMDGKPLLVPWGMTRDRPEHDALRAQDADGFSPKFHHEALRAQDKGSPRKDFYKDSSPPTRDHDFGKYNSFKNKGDDYESDDDEYVKNTKQDSKQNFFKEEGYDHNEKYKGNGHGQTQPRKHTHYDNSYDDLDLEKEKGKSHAPIYTSNKHTVPRPSLNYPKQETYYEKAPTYYNAKSKGKGNDDYNPPYTVPTTIIPRKETYYDASKNRPMMMPNPPPIRTRIDRGKDAEFYNEGKNPPVRYNNAPSGKDHQGFGETIDSSEARRRYGKALPRDIAYVAEDYTGVIDSREAARRYGGVHLTS